MDSYFAKFPEFSRVLENTNELEFSRLRSMRGWTRSSAAYRKAYHQFREAMLEETGSEVDKFFLTEYPSFDHYRLGEPRRQFQRLQQSALWARRGGGDGHKAMFTAAYAADFDRNVDRFFKQYGGFDYNPRGEAKVQFEELRKKMDWHFPKEPERWNAGDHKRNTEYASARAKFFTAFIADFKCFFGVGDDVQDWVFLCDVLRVRPAPQTVEECRAALSPYHVNIFNLLDHGQRKLPLIMHPDLEALKKYSFEKRLIFPLERAEGTCMEFLLRRLDD